MRRSPNKNGPLFTIQQRQEIETYHTHTHKHTHTIRFRGGAVMKSFFSLLKIKESKMKLALVVIDSLSKRWLGDPEILVCYKYLKAEMTGSLLGCTDD